jgi:pyrophosphatase PpaX
LSRNRESSEELGARVEAVETVLFDLDGTLIDTIDLIRESMRYATERVLGKGLPDDVLMRDVGVPLIVQMRAFDEDRAEELLLVYREHNARVHDAMVKEYPGVEATLEGLLSSGKRLGVVTSKSGVVAWRGLDLFGLGRFFETVVTCDDVPVHKPDPYPLLHAASRMNTSADRCAYVGDSPHDMTAAIGAEFISVAALWGGFSRERVLEPGPTHVAESMSDVSELFSGNEERFRA